VSTLARHLCLRAPDKADNRAAAIKAAAELVVELPQWEQEQFVGFVFDLSRTKQVRPVSSVAAVQLMALCVDRSNSWLSQLASNGVAGSGMPYLLPTTSLLLASSAYLRLSGPSAV
jgi:hypothetical protein